MASVQRKSSQKHGLTVSTTHDDLERPLQAVVLSDSYNTRFRPLTYDVPRCLLPLANRPLIEYTLEFLAHAGVATVFIFCSAHAKIIQEYIKQSKWSSSLSPFSVKVYVSSEALSVGDVMREIDSRQLINSDFILVAGDVVSNISLQPILQEHLKRREEDKNNIMTMIVREAGVFHRTRSRAETAIFVMDSHTKKCVHYESAEKASDARKIFLDLSIFQEHSRLDFRHDLIDCQIDICSQEVPALFTENFDYQSIRNDFVHGILTSDILGKKIYCSLQSKGYAARVRNYQTYDAITHDILCRWTYPLVPDSNFSPSEDYEYKRHNIYKEKSVILDPDSHIESNTLVGAKTEISNGTIIRSSVIGKNCKISNNVIISSSFLFDDVQIGKNSMIENAILADKVIIGDNCRIAPGTVLGKGVCISDGVEIKKAIKISGHPPDSDDSDSDEDMVSSTNTIAEQYVGTNGYGFLDKKQDNGFEEEEEYFTNKNARNFFNNARFSQIKDFQKLGLSDSTISSDSDLDSDAVGSFRSRVNSTVAGDTLEDIKNISFISEVIQSLQRAFEEKHSIDNAALEVNTLRMAENASYEQVRLALVIAILQKVLESGSGQSITTVLASLLKHWGPLIRKFLFSEDDQRDLIQALQTVCSGNKEYMRCFGLFLQNMYNYDIVDDEAIMLWYNSAQSQEGTAEYIRLRVEKGAQMVKWLNEAEEDSEDEEDQEDSHSDN